MYRSLESAEGICKGLSAKQEIVPWAELNVRARGTQSKGLLLNAG